MSIEHVIDKSSKLVLIFVGLVLRKFLRETPQLICTHCNAPTYNKSRPVKARSTCLELIVSIYFASETPTHKRSVRKWFVLEIDIRSVHLRVLNKITNMLRLIKRKGKRVCLLNVGMTTLYSSISCHMLTGVSALSFVSS